VTVSYPRRPVRTIPSGTDLARPETPGSDPWLIVWGSLQGVIGSQEGLTIHVTCLGPQMDEGT